MTDPQWGGEREGTRHATEQMAADVGSDEIPETARPMSRICGKDIIITNRNTLISNCWDGARININASQPAR